MRAVDYLVHRGDLHRTSLASGERVCGEGQILVMVEHFALSANTMTYAVMGDAGRYWDFFPAPPPWGRIPVWGFGTIVASDCAGVRPGDRLYGCFPMSTCTTMKPEKVRPSGLVDASSQRAHLSPVYNYYVRVAPAGQQTYARETEQMLLRPLFYASFLAHDLLDDMDRVACIVVTSASSKTAIGLAHRLRLDKTDRGTVIGLTSDANRSFVTTLGIYDRVCGYAELDSLPRATTTIFDLSGSATLVASLADRLGDNLARCCLVGYTHWAETTLAEQRDARIERFSAPDRMRTRTRDWGAAEFETRFNAAFESFAAFSRGWLRIVEGAGPDAVENAYAMISQNRVRPDEGHILSV